MVGPSSSHTAGACRIGAMGAKICGSGFTAVDFFLHGSFAYTYQGHGTDRALLGGVLGYAPDDDRLRDAVNQANNQGLQYAFQTLDLGDSYHPNTVKIVFHYEDRDEYIIGSSVGGGAVVIVDINGMEANFRGLFPTLLLRYEEQSGVIAYVSGILSGNGYSIESINTVKDTLRNIVTLTVEVEKPIVAHVRNAICEADRFLTSKYVEV